MIKQSSLTSIHFEKMGGTINNVNHSIGLKYLNDIYHIQLF